MNKKTNFFVILSLTATIPFCRVHAFTVPFDQSMATDNDKHYTPEKCINSPSWQLVKKLYEDNALNAIFSQQPRIPKIIHQIWLGSPFPEKYISLRNTWLALNPGWQYKLWTDDEIKALKLVNKKQYEKAKNYGERSDIARYEILYRFGGLYVDTDFECLQSFDIFHHCCDFYTGVGFGPEFEVYNGLIGSAPGNPVLRLAIQRIGTHKPGTQVDTPYATGPLFFGQCFYDALKTAASSHLRCVAFPCSYFYPWPCWERKYKKREEIEAWFKPETYAVHHWYTSWVNRRIKSY